MLPEPIREVVKIAAEAIQKSGYPTVITVKAANE